MVTERPEAQRRRRAEQLDRGEETRQRLLLAALEVFGRHGFEGATTRAIATAAGTNLQSIPYHFGDKQGLRVATADYIAGMIQGNMAEPGGRALARMDEADAGGPPLKAPEARELLIAVMRALATQFLDPEADKMARFMIREMMEPSEAFHHIFDQAIGPGLGITSRLVALILNEPPESEHVRLRTLSLVGSVAMYRMARASSLAYLGWDRIGQREYDAIQAMVPELVGAIQPV